jgi:NADH:ubiquinone oxidoreductase subunit
MHIGTLFYTWFKGEIVGADEFGNQYYKAKTDSLNGKLRRWVLYKGENDASKIPPEWHAWLHYTTDEPLTEQSIRARYWQKTHIKNLTGTSEAYHPLGHTNKKNKRLAATVDYNSWQPE